MTCKFCNDLSTHIGGACPNSVIYEMKEPKEPCDCILPQSGECWADGEINICTCKCHQKSDRKDPTGKHCNLCYLQPYAIESKCPCHQPEKCACDVSIKLTGKHCENCPAPQQEENCDHHWNVGGMFIWCDKCLKRDKYAEKEYLRCKKCEDYKADCDCATPKQEEEDPTIDALTGLKRITKLTEGLCHDCNCSKDEYHTVGCDMEICPKCGGQIISCPCNYEKHEDCSQMI